jgi:hypothetical protein
MGSARRGGPRYRFESSDSAREQGTPGKDRFIQGSSAQPSPPLPAPRPSLRESGGDCGIAALRREPLERAILILIKILANSISPLPSDADATGAMIGSSSS